MIGKTLGKYKIIDLLGRGGMAEVYRAYQANLDRNVALKLIKTAIADSPDSLARFERKPKACPGQECCGHPGATCRPAREAANRTGPPPQ
jgi:serine/threonine-protein kinase